MRTNFLNRSRKSRKPQLWAGQSCLVKESRVKSQGGDAWDKTTDVRSASMLGLDTGKALLGVPRERLGEEWSWVCAHTVAWQLGVQRHGQQASLHPQGDICPSKPSPPASGGAEESSQRGRSSRWLPWGGKSHGKGWMGPVGPLLQGNGFGLFTDPLVGDQHVSGWGFCFLSNHMLSSGGSQQVSHAEFKALAPHCLASWGVEIHDFH